MHNATSAQTGWACSARSPTRQNGGARTRCSAARMAISPLAESKTTHGNQSASLGTRAYTSTAATPGILDKDAWVAAPIPSDPPKTQQSHEGYRAGQETAVGVPSNALMALRLTRPGQWQPATGTTTIHAARPLVSQTDELNFSPATCSRRSRGPLWP